MNLCVTTCQVRYRQTREMLLALRGDGPWRWMFWELQDDDIRTLNQRARNREVTEHNREIVRLTGDECASEDYGVILEKAYSRGEGRWTLSWIWYSDPIGDTRH